MIRDKWPMITLACTLLGGSAFAQDITFKVYATSSGANDTVWLGRGASQQQVVDHMDVSPATIKVEPTEPKDQPQEIFLRWHDSDDSSMIPIFTLNAFSGSNLNVFFSRQEVTPENVPSLLKDQCSGKRPQQSEDAFKRIFICRSVYFYSKDKDNSKWTKPVRSALNEWFTANYFLYTQPTGNISFSPFGLQDDLIAELQTLVQYVDDNHYNPDDFQPLNMATIKTALQEKQTESIRMAGFVPGLIRAGKLDEAGTINDGALKTLQTLSSGKSGIAIQGVTEKVLLGNQSYIQTLSK